jgi:hypothetical protein
MPNLYLELGDIWQNPFIGLLTITIAALWNATLNRNTSVVQTLGILLGVIWPTFFEGLSGTVLTEIETKVVLAIEHPLKIHQRKHLTNFLLLQMNIHEHLAVLYMAETTHIGDQVRVHLEVAERSLQLCIGCIRDGFDIDFDRL